MVVVHPEYAMLILELNDLKEEIADLIVETDMLEYYVCKDIEVAYMLKIGALEYKLVVAENAYERNLRKLELINEKISKKQPVDIELIETKLDKEFKKQIKIEENMSADIDFAIEMSSLDLFDFDVLEEMNVDYFKLQKLYNPIFDVENSPEKVKMYKKIQKYYQKYNAEKLHKLAKEYDADNIFQDEISTLKMLKDKYIEILKMARRELRKIKNSFPYNQKDILSDENLCRRKKDSLNREITQINIENKKLEKKIKSKLHNI